MKNEDYGNSVKYVFSCPHIKEFQFCIANFALLFLNEFSVL